MAELTLPPLRPTHEASGTPDAITPEETSWPN